MNYITDLTSRYNRKHFTLFEVICFWYNTVSAVLSAIEIHETKQINGDSYFFSNFDVFNRSSTSMLWSRLGLQCIVFASKIQFLWWLSEFLGKLDSLHFQFMMELLLSYRINQKKCYHINSRFLYQQNI